MSSNTFTEALELAYAEVWRQGEYLEKIENGEVTFSGSKEGQENAHHDHWNRYVGGQKVLSVLLHSAGLVGRKGLPAEPDRFRPCIQQTWIRLMQWGIRKGLATQDELDEVIATSPQHAAALGNLGQDVDIENTDSRGVRRETSFV